jgi:hypothetical protein
MPSSSSVSRSRPSLSRTSAQTRITEATVSPVRNEVSLVAGRETQQDTVNLKSAGHERIDALFVQSATGFTSEGGTVTLHGLADSTVYFADRPRREVGHMRSSTFIELWDVGECSLALDPPNAVLSFLGDGFAPDDVVVVLHDPRLAGDEVTYRVDVLEGTLPERTGPCTLFIDAFGRPLRPVSGRAIDPASARPA